MENENKKGHSRCKFLSSFFLGKNLKKWYYKGEMEIDPVQNLLVRLQYSDFGCKPFTPRHVILRIAFLSLHGFRTKSEHFATKMKF